ncbi:sphere organelles protein-related [Raphanus sativus]|uniref:Coilin isoform X2 n=1 Tax=Raphanus sativus TaxID=3726 RepID=A0A6J0JIA5_RAPSA|nr:coilin isoform X2 [Raphanus sativus]KAJ4889851.1 sphere organelles protein-related [Raphanus sativus]
MAEETVRIRLVFEDQRILSKCQKKQGLKRSWVVLNPKYHPTVSQFSNHILYTFSLFEACPHGLSLYMDGFVLPPFESSCVLKDKDIVCVKRKKEALLEIVEEDSEENVCAAVEAEEERARILPGALLLIDNEEFQKETGGYESESEEEEIVPEKKTSKKRKASSKSISSRSKKCKLATTTTSSEETPLEREDAAVVNKSNAVKKRKTLDVHRTENDEQIDDANAKSMTKSKKSSLQEECNEPDELCDMSAETKKTPSRSARRKKAKRQWLREKTKLEKEELLQNQMALAPIQKPAITIIDYQVTKENLSEPLEKQQPDEDGDGVGDEVVPVEVRPGHIRFKPLDEASPETEPPAENILWNGNMTKKKGQKWGTEKTGFSKRYTRDLNEEDTYHTQPAEAETLANGQIDYEQLVAYTGSVKKGDIIAYRLIELTSSWTPEVSSFRVGEISYYDPGSKKVTLMPVEEYPIEKKTEEDEDSSMQADTSLYKEDGSLEVEFSSLLDVRSIKTSSSDVLEVANKPDQSATNVKLSTNSNGLQTTVKENGKGDPWEELSEALSEKKAKLCEANKGWNKKGSSRRGSWRRGSGMGPLMNYLRSQKEI